MADAGFADLTNISFRDPVAGAHNLARVAQRVPAAVGRALVQLLAESPDADSALNLFERLTASVSGEVIRLFERHEFLLHYAVAAFATSHYLGETLIQNPDLFHGLARERSLDLTHSRDDFGGAFARFRARTLDTDTSLLLARFKRREYVRIMLRDVLGIATLADTTAEISALSDVLLEEALRETDGKLRNRYGPPQHLDPDGRLVDTPFAVLSLGKLGGNELNYSSDIDLLFIYGEGTEAPGQAISNREYFIRLAQQLTETLSRMTREGSPFRIDLRLRPQGGEGEPAVGIVHALEYYENRAGDWERQALIKVRHSAGDQALARGFIRRVQPFVYTEELNFAAIETALATREKIGQRRRHAVATRRGEGIDVKLDRGGIRDIEFLVQCLQRVYGGSEAWLRSGGTLFSLQKLHDKGHLGGNDFHKLNLAYEFLRKVEHRLQLRHGQQTHRLPTTEAELAVLARMLRGPQEPTENFVITIRKHMTAVAEIYTRIIHQQQVVQHRPVADATFPQPEQLSDAQAQHIERLAIESPAAHEIVQAPDLQPHARRNLNRFLAAAFTSEQRRTAIVRSPQAMQGALRLFAISDYLTDMLVRHPEDLALLDGLPQAAGIAPSRSPERVEAAGVEYADKLARLRRQYRGCVLTSAARDILHARSVYESLAETSAAADEAITTAFELAGVPDGFAILALGRLGTSEHDLLSDADLLFIRDPAVEASEAARAAARIVEALSAYTREGTVFPVDTRLRPHGGEGELVTVPAQLRGYCEREAQPWEALTYTKLRPICGSPAVADEAVAAAAALARRYAQDAQFVPALREMRTKLEKTDTELDNLKTGPGGLYDIDFIVGSMLVRRGLQGVRGNLRARLGVLRDCGAISAEDWKRLDRHAELLRTAEHVVRIVTGKSRKTLPVARPSRAACDELCAQILKRAFPEGLDMTVRFALVGVREIYKRLL